MANGMNFAAGSIYLLPKADAHSRQAYVRALGEVSGVEPLRVEIVPRPPQDRLPVIFEKDRFPRAGLVVFRVRIGLEQQASYLGRPQPATHTTAFIVATRFTELLPITFVIPEAPRLDPDPLAAFEVVVRHLITNTRDSKQAEVLGHPPAPLPMTFALREGKATERLSFVAREEAPYRNAIYAHSRDLGLGTARDELFDLLSPELALFYYLRRLGDRRTEVAKMVREAAKGLHNKHSATGFRGFLGRIRSRPDTNSLVDEFWQARLDAQTQTEWAGSAIDRFYGKPGGAAIRDLVEDASRDDTAVALDYAEHVVAHLDNQRRLDYQVAFATGVGAAAVGAALLNALIR